MNGYMKALGLCVGLSASILLSSFNALFMTVDNWYLTLSKPFIDGDVISFCWLFSYVFTAITIGEHAVNRQLKFSSVILIVFLALNVLWCFFFFRLHALIASLIIFILILISITLVLFFTIKNTQYLWICVLINLIWYIYLFTEFMIIICNN